MTIIGHNQQLLLEDLSRLHISISCFSKVNDLLNKD